MKPLRRMSWRHSVLGAAIAALLLVTTIQVLSGEPEIALVIGESYESMRQRSSATIDPAIPAISWYNIPKSDARLRFIDPQYGFVTPLARFFTVSYTDGSVRSIRMSPQIEPLLLDDTLKVVLDLQGQWREGGWVPIRIEDFPSFADTPQWRAQLRNVNKGGKVYWRAGDKYQVMLLVSRFKDVRHPTEERYLITLEVAKARVRA
jgi:hypothetical protein